MSGSPSTHTSRVLHVSQQRDRGRSLAQAGLDAENRVVQVPWGDQQDPVAHGSRARQRSRLGLYRELRPGGCRGHEDPQTPCHDLRSRGSRAWASGAARSHGLDLVIHGKLAWDAEKEAKRVAEEQDKIYVSPYNDPLVVGGQGTCGYEISKQLPDLDAALFACGAGGLLKHKERFKGKKVVAVVCGRNINLEVFKRIIQ